MNWTEFDIDTSGLTVSGHYAISGDMMEVRAGEFGSKTMRLHSVSPDIALKVLVREIVKAWTRKRIANWAHPARGAVVQQAAA